MQNDEWKKEDGVMGMTNDKCGMTNDGGEPPAVMVKTPLGLEVAVQAGEEYREHTAERWRERDPASHAFALYLIRSLGIVNKSKLVELLDEHRKARGVAGISRNSVIALFNDPRLFKPGEIDEIIRTRSALLTADTLDKLEQIINEAKTAKDIGGVAMALTALFNVKQISHGAATRITGRSDDSAKARSFDHYKQLAEQRLRQRALEEKRDGAIEAEVVATECGMTNAE